MILPSKFLLSCADISSLGLLDARLTAITASVCNFLRQPGFTYSRLMTLWSGQKLNWNTSFV